jgi:glutamate synthase (NADPH) small chain
MGKPGAFLRLGREDHGVVDAKVAVAGYDEFVVPLPLADQELQASRCMDCGVAFCQSGAVLAGAKKPTGCPLNNPIPETNDLLHEGRFAEAAARLSMSNPFPEFTGRVCPAPCEQACNLGLHDEAVTIHDNERAISDAAWAAGMKPLDPAGDDASKIAVVGSGPAGLAAAWSLAVSGFKVTVFEKADRAGGLLMYGIPNMKLDKKIIERRVALMQESGIEFVFNVDAATRADAILSDYDAVVLACGFRTPRSMDIPGESLGHIRFAVDYLTESTKAYLSGNDPAESAAGKDVIVIGGGDTGVDCVATALRQGANSVYQIIRAAAPKGDAPETDWIQWPNARGAAKAGYGQLEAAEINGVDPRVFSTDTIEFVSDDDTNVSGVKVLAKGSDHADARVMPAQLVLIAKGFVAPEAGILESFHVAVATGGKPVALTTTGTHRAVIEAGSDIQTPVYVAGDFVTGSTLVASAMKDALDAAAEVKELFL